MENPSACHRADRTAPGNTIAMDHRGTSTAQTIDRRQTVGASYASPAGRAHHGAVEIANWLRSASDLQNPGRDLAKELGDTAAIARLTTSLDQCDRPPGQFSVSGRTQAAEGLLNVTGVSIAHPIYPSLPSRTLGAASDRDDFSRVDFSRVDFSRVDFSRDDFDRDDRAPSNCVDPLNIKLTAVAAAAEATAQKPRTTNHSSAWLWNVTPPGSVAVDGVVTHPGSWYEYSDAGI